MRSLRYCKSCSGPRPRAARRCPWCHRDYGSQPSRVEPLFANHGGPSTGSTMPSGRQENR